MLEPLREREDRTPVVLIPGITGSKLRVRETGQVVLGDAHGFFFPRDGGLLTALPIDQQDGSPDALEAFEAVTRVKILGLKIDIYASLIKLMEQNGYRSGDLSDPRPEDNFFLFPYDWRHGNIRGAQELARQLERLRDARGQPTLSVNLICQSNAARIARWFVKYGTATLEEAEAGIARHPPGIEIEKLIMVGAANGGAMKTLQIMNRGRIYVPLVGRRFQPETLFTFESLYEALPAYRDDLFVDHDGRPVDVDLFDADNWERFGWSIYSPEVRRRIERAGRPDLFADAERREAFLRRSLDRARRFQRLLVQDTERPDGTRYYLIGNVYVPTPERAVLVPRRDGSWRTLFSGDRRVRRDAYLLGLASAPGDGHVSRPSRQTLSPREAAALAGRSVNVDEQHRKIILDRTAHRLILEALLD